MRIEMVLSGFPIWSAFLQLVDGSCFAPRTVYYDEMMRAVVRELPEGEFRDWIAAKIPGEEDQDLGYGPWLCVADDVLIARDFDLRTLTPANQSLFVEAVRMAASRPMPEELEGEKEFESPVQRLAEMLDAITRGNDPLQHSYWTVVVPPKVERDGPGWD